MSKFRESVPDNAVPVILAAIAFGGSFAHWVKLVEHSGQLGIEALLTAVCVDLGAFMCARERARDIREGRKPKGWASWPTLAMAAAIILTLAGNVASAQRTPWGVISALIPGVFLLLAISLMERRSAERIRQAASAAERAAAALERERARQSEDERERQRQAEDDRQAQETERRRRERQQDLAERQAAIVTGASPLTVTRPSLSTVTRPSPRALSGASPQTPRRLSLTVAPADGDTASATRGVDVMRAYWDREVAAGRSPEDITGAELLREAGMSPASSLGRQKARAWRREAAAGTGSEASA